MHDDNISYEMWVFLKSEQVTVGHSAKSPNKQLFPPWSCEFTKILPGEEDGALRSTKCEKVSLILVFGLSMGSQRLYQVFYYIMANIGNLLPANCPERVDPHIRIIRNASPLKVELLDAVPYFQQWKEAIGFCESLGFIRNQRSWDTFKELRGVYESKQKSRTGQKKQVTDRLDDVMCDVMANFEHNAQRELYLASMCRYPSPIPESDEDEVECNTGGGLLDDAEHGLLKGYLRNSIVNARTPIPRRKRKTDEGSHGAGSSRWGGRTEIASESPHKRRKKNTVASVVGKM
jgi:hypothetical protein